SITGGVFRQNGLYYVENFPSSFSSSYYGRMFGGGICLYLQEISSAANVNAPTVLMVNLTLEENGFDYETGTSSPDGIGSAWYSCGGGLYVYGGGTNLARKLETAVLLKNVTVQNNVSRSRTTSYVNGGGIQIGGTGSISPYV